MFKVSYEKTFYAELNFVICFSLSEGQTELRIVLMIKMVAEEVRTNNGLGRNAKHSDKCDDCQSS